MKEKKNVNKLRIRKRLNRLKKNKRLKNDKRKKGKIWNIFRNSDFL